MPLLLSIKEACQTLGVGRTSLHKLLSAGELGYVKLGARTLVPRADIDALIQAGYRRRRAKADS